MDDLLNEVLEHYENLDDSFSIANVFGSINKIRQENKDIEFSDKFYAELRGMFFAENYYDNQGGWGTYYGPTIINGDFKNPDINDISSDDLDYWYTRYKSTKKVILKIRYLGLYVDLYKLIKNESPDFNLVKEFIQIVLQYIDLDVEKHRFLLFDKIELIYSLSIKYNFNELREMITEKLINLEEKISEERSDAYTRAYDIFIDTKKKYLTPDNEEKIITGLKDNVSKCRESNDISNLEYSLLKLVRYYRNEKDKLQPLIKLFEDSIIKSLENNPSVKNTWLDKVYMLYQNLQLIEECERILQIISGNSKANLENLRTFSQKIEISKTELDEYLNEIFSGSFEDSLERIAHYFITSVEVTKQNMIEMFQKSPITYLATNVILDEDGREIAKVNSIFEDEVGNLISDLTFNINFSLGLMHEVFSKILESDEYNTKSIINYLMKSPVFDSKNVDIISQGIDAFFKKDYVSCISILIPQLENCCRNLIVLNGTHIYQKNRNGGYNLITFEKILTHPTFLKAMGEDISTRFRAVFTDSRGMNIRNNICHGISSRSNFGASQAYLVIHSFLILGMIKSENK